MIDDLKRSLIVATLILAGCSGDDSAPGAGPGAAPGAAPTSAPDSGASSGVAARAPAPAAGAVPASYGANCVTCHGTTGAGDGSLVGALTVKPRSFAADEWRFVDFGAGDDAVRAEIARVLREGIPDVMMPAYASLGDDEIDALVEYVLVLRRRGRGDGEP